MKVYNQDKTNILQDYDLSKGYLKEDTIVVHREAFEGIEERFHYEVVNEYKNGGKDVRKVIDVEGVEGNPEGDIEEKILVYVPYSQKELSEMRIVELKKLLADTDYKAIKYAEGLISATEYTITKAQRQAWRDEINTLEGMLK